jgi:hypothetical protein
MELLVLITLLQRYRNCTCGCYYGNCFCTTTVIRLMKQMTLPLPLELLLLEQSMIMTMRPTVERSLRLHWILCGIQLYTKQSFCNRCNYTFTLPMELLVTDYTTTIAITVYLRVLLRELYLYHTTAIRLKQTKLYHCLWNCFGYWNNQ